MKKLRWLERHFEEVILVVSMAYISVCMFIQVIMRRVVNNSLSWSEESIRYVFIWMMFMGLGIGIRDDKHIKIDAIKNVLKPKAIYVLGLVSDFIFTGYSIYIFYYSVKVFLSFFQMHQTSAALGIPMYLVYLAAPVGFGLLIVRLVQRIVKKFREGPTPIERR